MKGFLRAIIAIILVSCVEIVTAAGETIPSKDESSVLKNLLVVGSAQADWTFTGMVVSEDDEHYQYYLEIHRDNQELSAVATLIKEENKQIILYEETRGDIAQADSNSLHAGRIFLRFNPINDSWIFGIKPQDNIGFNFRVEMLGGTQTAKQQKLQSGTQLFVMQTGRLNGHINLGESEKEQFVTSAKTWFRQIWANATDSGQQSVQGVLCQFTDGTGFYSLHADTLSQKSTVSGWRNSQGEMITNSNPVVVKEEKEGNWSLQTPAAPKLHLLMEDLLLHKNEDHHLIAGFITGTSQGFCAISQQQYGLQNLG